MKKPIKVGIFDLFDNKKYELSEPLNYTLILHYLVVMPFITLGFVLKLPSWIVRYMWTKIKYDIIETINKQKLKARKK